MKKLAFAAQQKLRGVIIEFDVIRSLRDPNMEFMQKMKYHVEKTNTSIQVKPKVKSKWWSNWFTRHQSTVSIRDKYKDKLLVLKKKSKQSICVEEEARRLDQLARLKWRVNEGANTFVDYMVQRGISITVCSPLDETRMEEYHVFQREMRNKMDHFLPISFGDRILFDDHGRRKIGLEPKYMIAIGCTDMYLQEARMAKMPSCAYWKDEYHQVANFDYRIDHLKEFRYIIEDLNGISYR